mmetsp:Transcript_1782/g.4087  ORF Transcript_1782/g.4087 Transcript_1782/m.4087 type:complete len:379 (-) Transcript_1782:412-1548(-)
MPWLFPATDAKLDIKLLTVSPTAARSCLSDLLIISINSTQANRPKDCNRSSHPKSFQPRLLITGLSSCLLLDRISVSACCSLSLSESNSSSAQGEAAASSALDPWGDAAGESQPPGALLGGLDFGPTDAGARSGGGLANPAAGWRSGGGAPMRGPPIGFVGSPLRNGSLGPDDAPGIGPRCGGGGGAGVDSCRSGRPTRGAPGWPPGTAGRWGAEVTFAAVGLGPARALTTSALRLSFSSRAARRRSSFFCFFSFLSFLSFFTFFSFFAFFSFFFSSTFLLLAGASDDESSESSLEESLFSWTLALGLGLGLVLVSGVLGLLSPAALGFAAAGLGWAGMGLPSSTAPATMGGSADGSSVRLATSTWSVFPPQCRVCPL